MAVHGAKNKWLLSSQSQEGYLCLERRVGKMMERRTMSHRFLGMARLCNLELTAAAVACTGPTQDQACQYGTISCNSAPLWATTGCQYFLRQWKHCLQWCSHWEFPMPRWMTQHHAHMTGPQKQRPNKGHKNEGR